MPARAPMSAARTVDHRERVHGSLDIDVKGDSRDPAPRDDRERAIT